MDERAFDERYRHWAQRSGELFTEASRYIPGGAGSSARTVKFGWKPYAPFMAEGSRSRLRDVDGHEYVDYLLGLGPMILGHRHPAVTRAVRELGTCFGLPYESGPGVPAELEATPSSSTRSRHPPGPEEPGFLTGAMRRWSEVHGH